MCSERGMPEKTQFKKSMLARCMHHISQTHDINKILCTSVFLSVFSSPVLFAAETTSQPPEFIQLPVNSEIEKQNKESLEEAALQQGVDVDKIKQLDEKIENLKQKFEKENTILEQKISKLFEKLKKEEQDSISATTNSIISIGTSILGAFFGKSTTASTLGKVASSAKGATKILKEKSDVKYVESEIQQLQIEKEELQKTLENEISKINEENKISNFQIEEIFIKPKRTDIFNVKLELLWKEE
mgnify:CR=1 FL=1